MDAHCNAITGLNGSGKSNILDSICFVLGITNLSAVRAGNLHELVYKQGQAGVTKATVTVTFDNSDPSCSPVGYESSAEVSVTRQVLIGGKSKYLVNGHTAQANQVANLFHSVSLNVNNPHFLIMQGRITKVLNMKPAEILGMVEEAAGTRMYETKKEAALKTIERKKVKVDELSAVLSEEITPTLERLRGEKQHYLTWTRNNAEIDRIERFVVAHEYGENAKLLDASKGEEADIARASGEAQKKGEGARTSAKDAKAQAEAIQKRLQGDVETRRTEAQGTWDQAGRSVVKAASAAKNAAKIEKDCEKEGGRADVSAKDAAKAKAAKEMDIEQDKLKGSAAKESAAAVEAEHQRLQAEYQNVAAGLSSEGEKGGGLAERIAKACAEASAADGKVKQAAMKIDHLGKSVKTFEGDLKKEEKAAEVLSKKRVEQADKVERITGALASLAFDEAGEAALRDRVKGIERAAFQAKEDVSVLSAQLEGRLAFQYSDPVKGFDRSKVKGLVAKLVTVKSPEAATALEVVAGGKLFQVVVDEAVTGQALLAKGKLQKRVTIIPLDKISSRPLPSNVVSAAADMAARLGSTARPAIELVGFAEDVRGAIEYVFGGSIIVDGMDAASKICDATKTKTVTMQGDVFDPSGMISGGSNKNLGETLAKLTELASAKEVYRVKDAELKAIQRELAALQANSKKFGELTDQLEIAKAELAQAEKHLSQTKYGMILEKYNAVIKEVADAKEEMAAMAEERDAKWFLHKELQGKEAELAKVREQKLKDIDSRVSVAKKAAAKAAAAAQAVGNSADTLRLELETLTKEASAALEAVEGTKKALEAAKDEVKKSEAAVEEQQALQAAAKAQLEEVEKEIGECSKEMKKINAEKDRLEKEAEAAELEVKKLEVQVARFHKEKGLAEQTVKAMLKKHPWIESEKEHFGVSGGDYDFEKQDPTETGATLKRLRLEQTTLSKKINKKVMGMIEKAEGEYTELLRKRKVIENDKNKIESVINELDVKKKTELERTWVKINRDFGSIFSTLLPGATAKLEPPEGQQAWQGLEVKVAFGDVWKQSLTELSGGQRSLLALSLILSMLLFKPAPMYILDEVDAALDLSHTQNIGNMLKTHFSQSQFIVVSLKEGMFNNANVIFRTKFVDGVSTVTKTIGIGASVREKPHAVLKEKNGNEGAKATGKASAAAAKHAAEGVEN